MAVAISNYATKKVIEELKKEIEGKRLNNVQQIGKELFKFTFSSPKKELLIEPGVRMHLTSYKFAAPEKASQVSMFLRKKLKGKKLLELSQHGEDRIAVFKFPENYLIIEFFSHGNFVLTDNDYNILFTFRKEAWKDRELKKGVKYKFPSNLKVKIKEDYSPVTKQEYEKQGSMNKALDEHYASLKQDNPKMKKLLNRLEHQKKALKEYEEKAKLYKRVGDWIYENYSSIEKLLNSSKQELEKLGVKRKGRKIVLEKNFS